MRDAAFWMAQVRDPRILVSVLWNVFCCGGAGCVDKSLSGANVSAKCWDGSQLPILGKREPLKAARTSPTDL